MTNIVNDSPPKSGATCPLCKGLGSAGFPPKPCTWCNGRGVMVATPGGKSK